MQVNGEMQKVTEYFGERYDATDPGKVLRVIRDFMLLFDKAIFEIKVQSLTYIVLTHSSNSSASQPVYAQLPSGLVHIQRPPI